MLNKEEIIAESNVTSFSALLSAFASRNWPMEWQQFCEVVDAYEKKRIEIVSEKSQEIDAEELANIVNEYLHWREVNPHIKGGENYLKRLSAALPKAMGDETPHHGETVSIARCPVCHWPLAKTAAEGCVIGNCSYRPSGKGA